MNVKQRYHELLEAHGRQGWWPLPHRADEDGFDADGYHPGRYDVVTTEQDRFAIYTGAVLTQNTTWQQAAKAQATLFDAGITGPSDVLDTPESRIADLITSARYYNTKAQYLKHLAHHQRQDGVPTRNDLLGVKGVGEETADTILCYAHDEPRVIADTYTRRWLHGHDITVSGYEGVRAYLDQRLPRDTVIRQEFHALIVAAMKQR